MVLKGDGGPVVEGEDLFSLKTIKNLQQITTITDQSPEIVAESDDEEKAPKKKYEIYSKGEGHLDSSGLYYKDSDSELEIETEDEDAEESKEGIIIILVNSSLYLLIYCRI